MWTMWTDFITAILELQLPVNNFKVDSCNKTQRKKSLDLRSVTCIPFTIIVRIFWGQYLCCLRKYMYIYPYPSRSFLICLPSYPLGNSSFSFYFFLQKPWVFENLPLPCTLAPNLVHWQFTVILLGMCMKIIFLNSGILVYNYRNAVKFTKKIK